MIHSMTGYGEAEADSPAGRLRLELKSVNHRFFNANVKTPHGFDRFEHVITEGLKRHLTRGHVTAYLTLDRGVGDAAQPVVDMERARGYRDALDAVKSELGVPGTVDLAMLARFGDVFRPRDDTHDRAVDEDTVAELTSASAAALKTMRAAEGERLEADLRSRLDAISAHLDVVEARAPERLVEHRDRLRTKVAELTEQVEVDEDRLAREIAYLAERWDVNEELVRFRSHLELFAEALSSDGSEPVGKRLGFLVQEMLREANTIGSKANDTDVTHASVTLKEEIERVREQVENVE